MEPVRFAVVLLISALVPLARGAEDTVEVKRINYQLSTNISGVSFEITIRSDGTVKYNGEDLVKELGHRTSNISRNDFQKLVHKIHQIKFFALEDRYDSYQLERPAKSGHKNTQDPQAAASEATAEGITVTDLPSQIVTVVTTNGTKSVDDRLGAPRKLFELERLILDVIHASQWTGFADDARDVPYYDSFPVNKRVTYRGLVQSYKHSIDRNAPIAGYTLQLMHNPGIDFELKGQINLQTFEGWIVDATGKIEEKKGEPEFVVTSIHRMRKYLPLRMQKK